MRFALGHITGSGRGCSSLDTETRTFQGPALTRQQHLAPWHHHPSCSREALGSAVTFPMPQPHCSLSGPAAVPVAMSAPGILGRPLTPDTDQMALGQILRPLGMGCPHLPAAPWNGPQLELDTVPAATQGDTIPGTCEHLWSTYSGPGPMEA